jgi:spore maturation protein CgeB
VKIVILGLSITSSWGNGHATTYRALVRELVRRGHDLLFLERDQSWYAENRDLPRPPFGRTELYRSVREVRARFGSEIRDADCVILGSFVPNGISIGDWVTRTAHGVTAFYDIDTPITLAALAREECWYLSPELIPRFDIYLSFTGGPALKKLERRYGSPFAQPLYCSVDPELYSPMKSSQKWALGYLGTFSDDRQPALARLLFEPAARNPDLRFVVAGPQYPEAIRWPANVERMVHLNPSKHRAFYNAQRFTLNITRAEMVRAGYSPSVRLFEAAACGTPVISDDWPGLDEFFTPNEEILVAKTTREVEAILRDFPEQAAREIGKQARRRVLAEHTAAHRAAELEVYLESARESRGATASLDCAALRSG